MRLPFYTAKYRSVAVVFTEAASTLGHTKWSIFWRVDLPLIRKGLAVGLVLSGGRALGEVGISLMLGGNIFRAYRNAFFSHL